LRVGVRADAQAGHVTVDETQPGAGQAAAQVNVNVAQPSGAPLELDLSPTGPGRYEGSFPLADPGTYLVRVQEQRDGAAVASAETGLPVSYPAEFRRVTADPQRLRQIALAGGGHVLVSPSDAFAQDLPPTTTPLPLQRLLLVIAAVILPIEVGLRRLRVTPGDVLEWLRHPRRIALALPRWAPDLPVQAPVWVPGARSATRRTPAPASRSAPYAPTLGSTVTPGLARDSTAEPPATD